MWIGHRKEIRKLTFRALARRLSEKKCFGVLIYSKEQKKLKCYVSYFNTAWYPVMQNHFWQSLLKKSNCTVMAEKVERFEPWFWE